MCVNLIHTAPPRLRKEEREREKVVPCDKATTTKQKASGNRFVYLSLCLGWAPIQIEVGLTFWLDICRVKVNWFYLMIHEKIIIILLFSWENYIYGVLKNINQNLFFFYINYDLKTRIFSLSNVTLYLID